MSPARPTTWKAADVDAQRPPIWFGGGYDAQIAGPNPWTLGPLGNKAPGYLKGQSATVAELKAIREAGRAPHAYTDSAPSAGRGRHGRQVVQPRHQRRRGRQADPDALQHACRSRRAGRSAPSPASRSTTPRPPPSTPTTSSGTTTRTSAATCSASPASARTPSPSSRTPPTPASTWSSASAWATRPSPRNSLKQGKNAAKGNLFLADDDLEKVDARNGGKYVVAQRTPGVEGRSGLLDAANKAARGGKRLFGFYGGNEKDHLPYRTADGKYDPVHGIRGKAENYTPADLRENPTLAEMTQAALTALSGKDPKTPFALFVEAGDVDFALHNNNLDNAVGAVLSGDEAVEVILKWIKEQSDWDDSALIVTADHGHYLVLDDPKALIRKP